LSFEEFCVYFDVGMLVKKHVTITSDEINDDDRNEENNCVEWLKIQSEWLINDPTQNHKKRNNKNCNLS
jgi:hypothetical protein